MNMDWSDRWGPRIIYVIIFCFLCFFVGVMYLCLFATPPAYPTISVVSRFDGIVLYEVKYPGKNPIYVAKSDKSLKTSTTRTSGRTIVEDAVITVEDEE